MRKQVGRLLKHFGSQWYDKLSMLMIALIMWQVLFIFKGNWWETTFQIVGLSLVLAVLVDWLLPVRARTIKLLLQIALVAWATGYISGFKWASFFDQPWSRWEQIKETLRYNYMQLMPFIMFSASVLLVYVIIGLWIRNRRRMMVFAGAATLVLTITDSFTPIWLWDKVAWVLFASLLWLVASHFHKLQKDHPRSWRELLEYPLQLLMPIVIVFSVLLLVGLNLPSITPLIKDPYTLWMESKGQSVSVFLGEKMPASITSLGSAATTSGYSRDDSQIGGGFSYDYSPVMKVKTTHRSYWRGESRTFYSGLGWPGESEPEPEQEQVLDLLRKEEELPLAKWDTGGLVKEYLQVEQMVSMENNQAYPVLFAARPIQRVNRIDYSQDTLPTLLTWLPEQAELRVGTEKLRDGRLNIEENLSSQLSDNNGSEEAAYPSSYSVVSKIPVLDEAVLRKTTASIRDSRREEQYLQLPDTLPQRVRDLAHEVTQEASNDYDRAKLLEQYLKTTYAYSNQPDMTKVSGEVDDVVYQFLFELQEGYCDYFSTAMTVMARTLDLPARWVKGFAPGTLPLDYSSSMEMYQEGRKDPNGAGTYTVRNADAHSWVEIFFEGYGWVSFEPTSGFSLPNTTAAEVLPEKKDELQAPAATSPEKKKARPDQSSILPYVLGTVLVLAVAAVILFWQRNRVAKLLQQVQYGSKHAHEQIVIDMHRLLRRCSKCGYSRQEHETLREAVVRWVQDGHWLQEEMLAVLASFERAKYNGQSVTSEEAMRFREQVKLLKEKLK